MNQPRAIISTNRRKTFLNEEAAVFNYGDLNFNEDIHLFIDLQSLHLYEKNQCNLADETYKTLQNILEDTPTHIYFYNNSYFSNNTEPTKLHEVSCRVEQLNGRVSFLPENKEELFTVLGELANDIPDDEVVISAVFHSGEVQELSEIYPRLAMNNEGIIITSK